MCEAPFQQASAEWLLMHQLPILHARRTDTIQVRLHLFALSFAAARLGQADYVEGAFSFDDLSGLRAGGWLPRSSCARALHRRRAYRLKTLNALRSNSPVVACQRCAEGRDFPRGSNTPMPCLCVLRGCVWQRVRRLAQLGAAVAAA